MKDPNIIYGSECACLFANGTVEDNCLKRYYTVLNVERQDHDTIAICNDYVRLKIKERIHTGGGGYGRVNDAMVVIEQILIDELKLDETLFNQRSRFANRNNELFDRNIHIVLLDKPFLHATYSMKKAIKIAMTGNYYMKKKVVEVIKDYVNTMTHKKYITRYKSLPSILKEIDCTYNTDNLEFLFMKLLNTILEINIKNK
jgi:hypothetical protein